MTRIAARGVEKLLRFSAETGEPLDIHQPGSLKIARRPEHAAQLEADVAHGREQGVPIRLVTTAEAWPLMPFLEPWGIEAISYNPRDVYLNQAQLPVGYARAAARLGCAILPETRVEEITVAGGAVQGMQDLARGDPRPRRGRRRRRLAAPGRELGPPPRAGRRHAPPAHRHQADRRRQAGPGDHPYHRRECLRPPLRRRPDARRLRAGPAPGSAGEDAAGYSIDDMPLDRGVLRWLAGRVADQFPVFKTAEVALVRGGLPTMTPDGEHVVGPLPGVAGLFAIGGCNVGGLDEHRRWPESWPR